MTVPTHVSSDEAMTIASKVAMLTLQSKLVEDQLKEAKSEFLALGVRAVVLPSGTKVAAITSDVREFDQAMLKDMLTRHGFGLVTKTTVSATQFDSALLLGKIPVEANQAVSFVPRTVVKVNAPRA